jgi:exo-beta-1,3-glucanase (GH17 family)
MSDYQSLGMNAALEKKRLRERRSKFLIISAVVLLVVLAAVGISVGVVVSKNNNKKNVSTSSTSSGSGTNSTPSGSGSTPPSDPRLKKVFWAMAYTPDYALPDFNCAATQSQINRDIQLMSQLTKRVRLYGADCNQTAMVLEAIKQNNADIELFTGIYITENDDASYTRQRDAVMQAIKTYGTDHIAGITVGNEFMLNYLNAHGATEPNSTIGDAGAAILIEKIQDTRTELAKLKLSKTIAVGNSDAGYYFNLKVLAAVDFGLSNVHAWFANTSIADAAPWVFKYFDETNVVPASQLPNKPKMYVSETGWPTASSDPATAINGGGAAASVANLQIFIDGFVCKANQQGLGYFFFEFIDEQWKEKRFGGVEGHWGLFDKDYNLKDIKLPDCLSP